MEQETNQENNEDNQEPEQNNSACIFPRCPKCGKGWLLPFSYKEDVFEKWKCSECKHTIEKKDN